MSDSSKSNLDHDDSKRSEVGKDLCYIKKPIGWDKIIEVGEDVLDSSGRSMVNGPYRLLYNDRLEEMANSLMFNMSVMESAVKSSTIPSVRLFDEKEEYMRMRVDYYDHASSLFIPGETGDVNGDPHAVYEATVGYSDGTGSYWMNELPRGTLDPAAVEKIFQAYIDCEYMMGYPQPVKIINPNYLTDSIYMACVAEFPKLGPVYYIVGSPYINRAVDMMYIAVACYNMDLRRERKEVKEFRYNIYWIREGKFAGSCVDRVEENDFMDFPNIVPTTVIPFSYSNHKDGRLKDSSGLMASVAMIPGEEEKARSIASSEIRS